MIYEREPSKPELLAMPTPRGSASYKKKDGTITLSKDRQDVLWIPVAPPGAAPALSLGVSSITSTSPDLRTTCLNVI